jgi:hypothetical protein
MYDNHHDLTIINCTNPDALSGLTINNLQINIKIILK